MSISQTCLWEIRKYLSWDRRKYFASQDRSQDAGLLKTSQQQIWWLCCGHADLQLICHSPELMDTWCTMKTTWFLLYHLWIHPEKSVLLKLIRNFTRTLLLDKVELKCKIFKNHYRPSRSPIIWGCQQVEVTLHTHKTHFLFYKIFESSAKIFYCIFQHRGGSDTNHW